MNTKILILICLLGYISTQALKPTTVCGYDMVHGTSRLVRRLQALKPVCGFNKASCCDSARLGKLKSDWKNDVTGIKQWFQGVGDLMNYVADLFSKKDWLDMKKLESTTVCKGMNVNGLYSRRLQAMKKPCPQVKVLRDLMKAFPKVDKAAINACEHETLKVGAGGMCQMCDKAQLTMVDQTARKFFVDHKTANSLVMDHCNHKLSLFQAANPLLNAVNNLFAGRRLQALKPKVVDYVGFDIKSCLDKSRRLQALKKDQVQTHKECADLALWWMNNTLFSGSQLHQNPTFRALVEKATNAFGTDKAKAEFTKIKNGLTRRLQAVKPKQWSYAFNAAMTGFVLLDHAPDNVETLL